MFPFDVAVTMEMVGRFEFDPQGLDVGEGVDPQDVAAGQVPLLTLAQAKPDKFMTTLAEQVVPVGGWAAYGAARTIVSMLGPRMGHPAYDAIFGATLNFLRNNGVPNNRLNGYEWQFWIDHQGQTEPWLRERPVPTADEGPMTELLPGERRRIAQVNPELDSNIVYVQRSPTGGYQAVIESRYSDDDQTRVEHEWLQAETLRSLYTQVGQAFQAPTYWFDPELALYFPLATPKTTG